MNPAYQKLRAQRRRAQRKARRSKMLEDLTKVRQIQTKTKRELEYWGKRRWISFWHSILPNAPTVQAWRIVRSLNSPVLQRQPLRALALHRGVSDMDIAEEFCRVVTHQISASITNTTKKTACPLPTDSNYSLNRPFNQRELKWALKTLRRKRNQKDMTASPSL